MITDQARNLNTWQNLIHVKSHLGEGVRVTFCLKSLATQVGSVKTRDIATERLSERDELMKISHSVKLTGSSVSDLTMLE